MGCLCCAGWKKKQAADGFYYIDRLPLSLHTDSFCVRVSSPPSVFVLDLHCHVVRLLAAQPWHLVLWIFALGNFAVSWCERKASNAILRSLAVIVCFIRLSNAPGVSRKDYNLRIDICQAIQIFFLPSIARQSRAEKYQVILSIIVYPPRLARQSITHHWDSARKSVDWLRNKLSSVVDKLYPQFDIYLYLHWPSIAQSSTQAEPSINRIRAVPVQD